MNRKDFNVSTLSAWLALSCEHVEQITPPVRGAKAWAPGSIVRLQTVHCHSSGA